MAKTYQIITQLPENLYQQVEALAVQENLSLDQLVALALSAQVKAWSEKNDLAERAPGELGRFSINSYPSLRRRT